MKRNLARLFLILTSGGLILTGCGAGKSATPTDVAKALYEAKMKKDAAAMKKMFSKNALGKAEEVAVRNRTTVDKLLTESNKPPESMPECFNEKIEGEKATLECKDSPRPLPFVKENGEWKFDGH